MSMYSKTPGLGMMFLLSGVVIYSLKAFFTKTVFSSLPFIVFFTNLSFVFIPSFAILFLQGPSGLLSSIKNTFNPIIIFNSIIDFFRIYMRVYAIQLLPMSLSIPTSASWQFFAMIFSALYGLEEITLTKIVSFSIAFLGIMVVNFNVFTKSTISEYGKMIPIGILLILMTSVARGYIAVQHNKYTKKYEVLQGLMNQGFITTLLTGIVLLVYIFISDAFLQKFNHVRKFPIRSDYLVFLFYFIILFAIGSYLYYLANQELEVSTVVIYSNIGILMSFLIGYLAFKESITWNKVIGLFLIVIAVLNMEINPDLMKIISYRPPLV